MICTAQYDSPVGKFLLAAREDALTGLWMERQKYFPEPGKEKWTAEPEYPVLIQACRWLDRYFAGEKPRCTELKLAPEGSRFRQIVWEILCQIPYGELTTYGKIAEEAARRLGREHMSAQAVGGAVGHNPLSIMIPCHRVVGTGGNLTGYAGGLEKKIALLTLEGVDMSRLFLPKRGSAL